MIEITHVFKHSKSSYKLDHRTHLFKESITQGISQAIIQLISSVYALVEKGQKHEWMKKNFVGTPKFEVR